MVEKVDLIDQVMSWEAEAITAKKSLKEAELSKSEDVDNVVDKALVKFKDSKELAALIKKDHDIGCDARVEAIFYNIWTHYRDLDYAFLGNELTNLNEEWLEEERLNAPDVTSPPMLLDPLTRDSTEIKISPAETFEQSSEVEVDEVIAAHDLSIAPKVPIAKPNYSVAAVQLLINLEEEPVATDTEEEPEATANSSVF